MPAGDDQINGQIKKIIAFEGKGPTFDAFFHNATNGKDVPVSQALIDARVQARGGDNSLLVYPSVNNSNDDDNVSAVAQSVQWCNSEAAFYAQKLIAYYHGLPALQNSSGVDKTALEGKIKEMLKEIADFAVPNQNSNVFTREFYDKIVEKHIDTLINYDSRVRSLLESTSAASASADEFAKKKNAFDQMCAQFYPGATSDSSAGASSKKVSFYVSHTPKKSSSAHDLSSRPVHPDYIHMLDTVYAKLGGKQAAPTGGTAIAELESQDNAKNKSFRDYALQCAKEGIFPVQISKDDAIWATGKDGKGKNLLGIAILEAANEILIEEGEEPTIPDPWVAWEAFVKTLGSGAALCHDRLVSKQGKELDVPSAPAVTTGLALPLTLEVAEIKAALRSSLFAEIFKKTGDNESSIDDNSTRVVLSSDRKICTITMNHNDESKGSSPVTLTRTQNEEGKVEWKCDGKALTVKQSYALIAVSALAMASKQIEELDKEITELKKKVEWQVPPAASGGIINLLSKGEIELRALIAKKAAFESREVMLVNIVPSGGVKDQTVPGYDNTDNAKVTANERDAIVAHLEAGYTKVQIRRDGQVYTFDSEGCKKTLLKGVNDTASPPVVAASNSQTSSSTAPNNLPSATSDGNASSPPGP